MIRAAMTAILLLGLGAPAWAQTIQLSCATNGVRTEPLPAFLVAEIQQALADLGYRPGPADGILGPRTMRSIEAFRAKTEGRSGLSTREQQLEMLLYLLPSDVRL